MLLLLHEIYLQNDLVLGQPVTLGVFKNRLKDLEVGILGSTCFD